MHTIVRGRCAYEPTYRAMQAFTAARNSLTPDALWLCEHEPVYTQGLAGRSEHLLRPTNTATAVVATDRGGQITFHGPGQVVAYPLLDLRRAGYYVKEYVYRTEEAVIRTLRHWNVTGHRVAGAPGIYVRLDDPSGHARLQTARTAQQPDFAGLGKIAALGVKVSRHCAYHGVALNVAMDLSPFEAINPCGYAGLQTVDLSTIGVEIGWEEAAAALGQRLVQGLSP